MRTAPKDAYWIRPVLFLRANLLTVVALVACAFDWQQSATSTPRLRRPGINQTSRPDLCNWSRKISHFLAIIITFLLRPMEWMEFALNAHTAVRRIELCSHSCTRRRGVSRRLKWPDCRLKMRNWCNCNRPSLSLKVHYLLMDGLVCATFPLMHSHSYEFFKSVAATLTSG